MTTIENFVEKNKEGFLNNFLIPWLSIPSISSDKERKQDTLKACEFLEKELESSGLDVKQITLEQGNPVVYAEKIVNPDLSTVLVYGHYDVQPIKLPDLWQVGGRKLGPFQPVIIGDRLYARGATDDKGQLAAHALAMRYFNQEGFPCNIKFIVEGNEEGGESSFYDFITKNGELLACDAILISDTGTLEEGHPALTTSLKGILAFKVKTNSLDFLIDVIHNSHDPKTNRVLLKGFYDDVLEKEIDPDILEKFGKPSDRMGEVIKPEEGYNQLHHRWYRPTDSPLFLNYANSNPVLENGNLVRITVRGPKEALHSGSFGGPVQEPALIIAHLLAGLKERGVRCDIDYIDYGSRTLSTSIQPSGEAQIIIYNQIKKPEELINKVAEEYSLPKSLITVEELEGYSKDIEKRTSYLEDGFNLDRFGDGRPTAYLSFRLVPSQSPDKVEKSLLDLIDEKKPDGVDFPIETAHSAAPFMTDTNDECCEAVIKGLKQGYGAESVHIKAEGGSIPITHTLYNTLKAPIILAGFSSPTDNLHAPNESVLIEKGILSGARSIIYSLHFLTR